MLPDSLFLASAVCRKEALRELLLDSYAPVEKEPPAVPTVVSEG